MNHTLWIRLHLKQRPPRRRKSQIKPNFFPYFKAFFFAQRAAFNQTVQSAVLGAIFEAFIIKPGIRARNGFSET
jgi:hypothetical protein